VEHFGSLRNVVLGLDGIRWSKKGYLIMEAELHRELRQEAAAAAVAAGGCS
jgi:hypothetical protein